MPRKFGRALLIAVALLSSAGIAMSAPRAARPAKTTSSGPPNALQGFSQNHDQPVHIEAANLEVRDKQQVATFSGDVRVNQGDTKMRCGTLKVYYVRNDDNGDGKGKKTKTMQAATPGPGGEQRIKRLEALGGVVVTQKDQTASGNKGIFDMATNTVTLVGNVVMTQGKNVLRGDKLVVNLTSGQSRVELTKNGRGRVEGLFLPSDSNGKGSGINSPLFGPIH